MSTKETTEAIGIVRKTCLICIVILATFSTGALARGHRTHGHAPTHHISDTVAFPRVGIATWYARTDKHGRMVHKNKNGFHKTTSDHELLDPHAMTCATNGVPFNTLTFFITLIGGSSSTGFESYFHDILSVLAVVELALTWFNYQSYVNSPAPVAVAPAAPPAPPPASSAS